MGITVVCGFEYLVTLGKRVPQGSFGQAAWENREMSIRLMVTAMVCCCSVASLGDEPEKDFLDEVELERWIQDSTASASPKFGVITGINKDLGWLEITYKFARTVIVRRSVALFGDKTELEPVAKFVIGTVRDRYSLEDRPVYDVDGKRIGRDEALERLDVGQTVVLSTDGKMVAARYRQSFRADTLILIPPVLEPLREHELRR